MLSIDNSWSSWLIGLSLVLNFLLISLGLFKRQVGAIIPESVSNRFRLNLDRQDHEQGVEVALVDSELQTKAAEQLREARREDRAWNTITQKDGYLHGYLNGKVDELKGSQEATRLEVSELRKDVQAGFSELKEEQKALRTATEQTNNILREMYVLFSKRPNV